MLGNMAVEGRSFVETKDIGSGTHVLITDYGRYRLGKHWGFRCWQALSPLLGSADARVRGPMVGRGEAGEVREARPRDRALEEVGLSL